MTVKRRQGRNLILSAIAASLVVAGSTLTSQPAQAVGNTEILIGSVGSFSNPLRPDKTALPSCVRYGTGDPATYSNTTNQDLTTPGAHNEIRSGEQVTILGAGYGPCFDDAADASGLGFTGVDASANVGDYFELGRFYHYNNTIQNSLHWATLNTKLWLADPFSGVASQFDATYQVEVQESPEKFGFSWQTPPTTAQCQFQPGATNSLDGSVIPAYVGNLNTGPDSYTYTDPVLATTSTVNRVACADSVYIYPIEPTDTIQWGETTVKLAIAGWARVDESGSCSADSIVAGPVVYTEEGSDNELCVLGEIVPAQVSLTKTVVGEAEDQTFQFELAELNQTEDNLTPYASRTSQHEVTTTLGVGTVDIGEVDPGLYALTEVNVPAGFEVGDLVCEDAQGASAVVTVNGVDYLDLDSGADVTCELSNTVVEEPTPDPTPSTTGPTPSTGVVTPIEPSSVPTVTPSSAAAKPAALPATDGDTSMVWVFIGTVAAGAAASRLRRRS